MPRDELREMPPRNEFMTDEGELPMALRAAYLALHRQSDTDSLTMASQPISSCCLPRWRVAMLSHNVN